MTTKTTPAYLVPLRLCEGCLAGHGPDDFASSGCRLVDLISGNALPTATKSGGTSMGFKHGAIAGMCYLKEKSSRWWEARQALSSCNKSWSIFHC